MEILRCDNLCKTYGEKDICVKALDNITKDERIHVIGGGIQ